MLITLYGVNNIGKSTQAELLVERLNKTGHEAIYVKYPVYSIEPTGPFLHEFLRSGEAQSISEEELQLWFTLNRFQFQPQLQEWLNEGKIVIAEDYTGTGLAWGTVKGADTEWLKQMNAHLIQEDLAILMDGERFKQSVESGHLHETDDALMKNSRQVHLDLGEELGWIKIPVLDGIGVMHESLWELLQLHLPEKSS
jgi:dTMP kinase